MTLCVAWLREVNGDKELVFATDSCLSGGERWHSGVKLFELPRQDCLICFAGETNRTYPLILNLISSIKFDEHLSNSNTDITEVLDYLTNLFTTLCNSITNYQPQSFKDALGDFQFLFGGWSWKSNDFRLWKLEYKHEAKAFTHDELENENMFFTFIGDELDKAREILEEETPRLVRSFDMEPFKVLIRMIRDKSFTSIDGRVQLAKIHPPGSTEFLGVYWPSVSDGKKTFLGKDVSAANNPAVKFVDPDTGEVLDENLPEKLSNIELEIYGDHTDFLQKCYPSGKLKKELSKREKYIIKSILTQIAYDQFINRQSEILEEAQEI
ncbi:MAG: hypothetical protein QNJ55_25075 [Xenococcus sp. MO_188.B8]|nr:hypothetical protein [Xenococcus sp. MO_188.B8]